jgi:thiol:disulfide interchange protein DsbA
MWKGIAALVLALAFAAPGHAQLSLEKFQAGVHYFPIEPALPLGQTSDKVEVVEVFSYACPACATFDPAVQSWKKRMPAGAKFSLLPAAWNPHWEMVARAYYAAEALGVQEATHDAFFKAMHIERKRLDTLETIAEWYGAHGVSAADFMAAMKSFAVDTRVNRSRQLVPRWGIDATPSVVVAGKYRVTGQAAGSYEQVFEIVDFLVAKESGAPK